MHLTSVTREEIQVRIKSDGLAFRTKEIGGQTMARVTVPKGADLGPSLKGLPEDSRQRPNWGYMIKGRLQMRTTAGDHVYEAGDAFSWAPGHVPVALEDCEYLAISPADQLEAVIGHVTGSLG
jgi:hypothetical protein